MRSRLMIFDMASGDSREVLATDRLIEAPNWMPDGSALIVNGDGLLFRVDLHEDAVAELDPINTEFALRCNNDHGISPCGREILLSDQSETGASRIYRLPIEGGTPVEVTPLEPSYWHGISPDGSTLAYCAERGGRFDIYTCPRDGGPERRLTDGSGHADGPDYSACGRYIWFNSDRDGHAQLWRMTTEGTGLTRMTDDERVNWFPHPSPCGDWVVYLSYEPGTLGHPRDREVELRLIDPEGGEKQSLVRLFGGQGTINVPSWAPDGAAFAYVAYER